MLKVDNIFVNYGEFEALHGISLEVNQGEIVALLGGNGAGKTTTIATISGQTTLKSGRIMFKDEDISGIPTYSRVNMGIIQVPEGRRLFPYMTVHENLLAGSYIKKARANREKNLEMCYRLFPRLAERKNQMAVSLSGGEQQMCAIARALMQEPELLMLDEPSLGLAPIVVEQIFDTLLEISKNGMTILIVEQNVAATLELAGRAYVIETGQNVISGDSRDLKENEEVKKAYLGI